MVGEGDVRNVPAPFVCSWMLGDGDVAWVQLVGELDLAAAPELQATLCEAEARADIVVLDLRQLTFMDSAGVHAILRASVRARQTGHRLILARGQRQVDRLLGLAGAAGVLEIDGSIHEPLADLNTRQLGTSVAGPPVHVARARTYVTASTLLPARSGIPGRL
jgi:anti-sigma B factor antagonist